MPDILFKKLITIETLGLIIAGLQLVIAYPQLKLAYKSVSSDEITSFRENIRQFNTHVESFVFVDIPDSLMNENVKIARRFQKQIYTYSLFIVNANWDRDISIHTFDIDSVMQTPQFRNDKTYDQLRIKKNQEFLNNYIFNMLAPQKITNVTERIQANNKGTQRLSETLNRIHEYYSNSADSTLLISQIEQKIMENTLSSQGELNTSLGQSLSKLETTYENIKRIRENKGLDIYNKEKKVKEEFIGFQSMYNQYLLNPAFNEYIKGMDEMCVDYIAFLNLIQLKYAYNVDLDLSRD